MTSVLGGVYPRSRAAEFNDVLTAEWTKFRSLRSMVWTLAAVAAIVPVFAVFVGLTGSLQPDDTILGGSLTGSVAALMVAGAFGVLVMTSEYGSNMIHSTFAASPKRSTVLAAKATLVAGVLFVTAIVSCFISYQIGTLLLSSDTYATGELMPALLGIGLCFSATGMLGLAVGVLLRNSAGAISAVIGFMLLPSLVGPLFGDFQRWLTGATPTSTLERLTQTSDATPEVVGSIGAWGGLAVLFAYSLAALLVAALRLNRRDA
jgi:ABC-2 type transport system permease protein